MTEIAANFQDWHPRRSTYLTRAQIVLADQTLSDSSVLVEDGVIAAIEPGAAPGGVDEVDLRGAWLMPGLIDLHCDALEKEVEPRPDVFFPIDFAVAQADRRNGAAGITTVFHALSFATEELGVRNSDFAAEIARLVRGHAPHALVDNRIHCRYEITDESGLPAILTLVEENAARLVSVMDHTPGQGQFKDVASYRTYLGRTYGKSREQADALIEAKFGRAKGAYERIGTLSAAARARGITFASHDDDTVGRVDAMHRFGATISEFPVTLEAAHAAKNHGMVTVFGAPNLLRGKSQSGSVRAHDAILAGVADCLCSDYSPASLLAAIFRLPETAGIPLFEAVRLATRNPAMAAGLTDRGEIAPGKRADLVIAVNQGEWPATEAVYVAGRKVFQGRSAHG